MNRMKQLIILMFILATTACAMPERGAPAFAPTMPKVVKAQPDDGSIYQSATSWPLYEDVKARHVGDVVVVVLNEKTAAEKKAGTSTSKKSAVATKDAILLGAPVTANGVPILNNSYNSDVGFDGKGDSTQSNKLTGTIAVTVKKVLGNGDLVVQGEKWISINQGTEYVRFRGIIRSTDIDQRNTISSTRVANAQIQYGGNGAIADSSSQGWLSRFFNSSWTPF